MNFTDQEKLALIGATQYKYTQTSHFVQKPESVSFHINQQDGYEFSCLITKTGQDTVDISLARAVGRVVDHSHFAYKMTGKSASVKIDRLIAEACYQCAVYVNDHKSKLLKAHIQIQQGVSAKLEQLLGSQFEPGQLMSRVESIIYAELDKFDLAAPAKFDNFFDESGLAIVAASIGEEIIAKAVMAFHPKDGKHFVRQYNQNTGVSFGYQEKCTFLVLDEATVSTREIPTLNKEASQQGESHG